METLVLVEPSTGPASSGGTVADHLLFSSSFVDRQSPNSSFNAFLDPMSLAEAIFFSDSSANGHESPHLPRLPNLGAPITSLSRYRTPKKRRNYPTPLSQVEPRITRIFSRGRTFTNTEDPGPVSVFSARRRFKDVFTLSDRLSESYMGFFIPLRPDKSVVEGLVMAKQEFVEQRRASLEKYLRRLAANRMILQSEELRVILEMRGKLPLAKSIDVASSVIDGQPNCRGSCWVRERWQLYAAV